MKNSICEYVNAHHTDILSTFNELHSMPEPALREVRTADYLKTQLKQAGFDVRGDFAKTAVLGIRDTGIDGPVIGIRADMDALCYEKEGKTIYIHSCGHDANCTAVLWAAKALLETGQLKAGSLKVLFQPAEETLQGAEAVIESRVLEGTQYLVSTHLRPQEELPMGLVSPAVLHGASGHIRVKIYGHEAHGAKPHQGVNAILTASAVIGTVNALPFNPSVPHSIKPTKISSGSNPFNIIPNYAEIMFDIRAQTNEVMKQIRESLTKAAVTSAESMGAKALAECEYKLEISVRQLGEQQIITEKERKNLDQIRIKVRELCSKAYLTPRLELFVQTLDGLRNYKELLASLQVLWGNYQNGLRFVESQEAYLEELEQDLDEIRYERIRIQQKIRELEGLLDSVRKQLELTDYEQIQERLDFCMKRLLQLPKERENSVREQEALEGEIQTLEEKIKENGIKKQEFLKKQEKYQYIFQKEYNLGYVEKNFVITEDMDDQARKVCRMFAGGFGNKKQSDLFGNLQEIYHQNRGYLLDYQITLLSLFGDLDEDSLFYEKSVKRIDISAKYRGISVTFKELIRKLTEDAESLSALLNERDRELFEDILANTISKKIRIKIQASRRWIEKMNTLMESMQTSSGLKLSLRWKNKQAQREDQLDTRSLVELLQKDAEIMREEEVESLSRHFRSKIEEARKISGETGAVQSFHATMREVLDYRKWFEFQLECQKTGEKKRELTDRVFFTFSGGEKAMSMYVPLFSAVVAKYAGANEDAPRLISLDEAFAGVDETNIRDMFRLMVEFEFNFMINSQILWGDYDTVPGLAIYQLIRPENAKFVSVIRYIWNGKKKIMTTGSTEQRS